MTRRARTKLSRKALAPETCARVAKILYGIIERDFGGEQKAAARALGWSASHVSSVLRGDGTRSVGVSCLISMRERAGMTLDEILGLPPLRPESSEFIRGWNSAIDFLCKWRPDATTSPAGPGAAVTQTWKGAP